MARNKTFQAGILILVLGCGGYLAASSLILSQALQAHRMPDDGTPADFGLDAEAIHLQTKDGLLLHGQFMPGSTKQAILLVHGLDSTGWRGAHRPLAKAYVENGFGVLLFDLRAQGASEGARLGLGWDERQDVAAAVDFLASRGMDRIGLHGTSYGAGTAILAAAILPKINAIIADSAFADASELMAQELERRISASSLFLPGMLLLGRWLHGLDLDETAPVAWVPRIAPRPILFIHGSEDLRIPVQHSRRLFAASNNSHAQLWILDGLGHTEGHEKLGDTFTQKVVNFMLAHLRQAG